MFDVRGLAFFLAAVLTPSLAPATPDKALSDDEFRRVFETVTSIDPSDRSKTRRLKWNRPIRVFAEVSSGPKNISRGFVEDVVLGIRRNTGIDIRISDGSDMNIFILFSRDLIGDLESKYQDVFLPVFGGVVPYVRYIDSIRDSKSTCFQQFFAIEGNIESSFVLINTKNTKSSVGIKSCLSSTLMISLGFKTIEDAEFRTVLSASYGKKQFSQLDYRLIRRLYGLPDT